MKRISIVLIIALVALESLSAGREVKDICYVTRDTTALRLDIYYPDSITPATPCILYMFGGGFMMGDKSHPVDAKFCKTMSELGNVVVIANYRLGLKGVTKVGVEEAKLAVRAITMAVEDLYSATNYLIENSATLQINRDRIILCGSSAGAITMLQADYAAANGHEIASVLPDEFRYAGVVSMAGALLSFEGKPKYKKRPPAPTLFFHGTDDKILRYDKVRLFSLGLFGTKALAKRFDEMDYPYCAIHVRDIGHEISEIPLRQYADEVEGFIRDYVIASRPLKIDIFLKDKELKPYFNIKNFDDFNKTPATAPNPASEK